MMLAGVTLSISTGVALFLVSLLLILAVGWLLTAGASADDAIDEPPTLDVQNHRDDD
jgi:hypothetical protein